MSPDAGMETQAALRKNFALIFFANASYAATQLLMLVAISRWTSQRDVGHYGFGLAITTPVVLALGMALREVALTDAAHQFTARNYIQLRQLTAAIALVITVGLALVLTEPGDEFATVCGLAVAKAIESLSEIQYGLWQRDANHRAVAQSLLLRALGGMAMFLTCLWLTRNVAASLAALAVAWLTAYRLIDWPKGNTATEAAVATSITDGAHGPNRAARVGIRALASVAWPMGIVASIVSLQINVPRGFVRSYLGTEALGKFTTITAVLAISSTVLVALGQTSGPRLAALWIKRSYGTFAALTARLIILMLALAGVGMVLALTCGDWIITHVFGQAYNGLSGLLAQICLAAGLFGISGILGVAALALRAFRLVSALQILSVLLTIAISWMLIPHGLHAAGWAVVVAAALSSLPPLGAFIHARRLMEVVNG